MRLGIMQPYLFPYLGYWQLLNYVDHYVVYDDVNYIKNGWINRNYIILNKVKHLITLPLNGSSPNKLINEISITPNNVVKRKLLKTIEMAYKKSTYFDQVFPMVESILMYPSNNIVDLIYNHFGIIGGYLDIDTQLILSSDIDKNNSLSGEAKVIEICHLLKANCYVNAIGGMGLYSKDNFEKEGINLQFLKSTPSKFNQRSEIYIENISIIDVMMNNSIEEIKRLLGDFVIT